jgi:hypothetical protein
MRRFLASRPSPAMAVAFVALLAALSGTAIALPGTNSVDSGDIKNGQVKNKDVRRNAITGAKVKNSALRGADVRNDSLTGLDINESTLAQVPSANTANTANSANSANTANTANNVAAPENFHEIGAPGEPGFQNGCANVPPAPPLSFEPVGFYKDREGRVHLKGVYECPAPGGVAFQLPAGYRPENGRVVAIPHGCGGCTDSPSADSEAVGLLLIVGAGTNAIPNNGADGAVLGQGDTVAVDGVSFRAEG